MRLTIESDRLQRRLAKIQDADIDFLVKQSVAFISTDLRSRFRKERAPDGRSWTPLSPVTIRDKQEKGYGGQPILVRTGALRNSVRSKRLKQLRYQVASEGVKYAEQHQVGDRNLPARPFIGISRDAVRGVKGLIDKFIRKLMYT